MSTKKDRAINYQKEYYKKKHSYMDIADTNYVNNLVEILIKEGKIKKNHKILEVGCGKGRFSNSLLTKGFNLTCVDISDNLLQEFKKNIPKKRNVIIIKGDINEIGDKFKSEFHRSVTGGRYGLGPSQISSVKQ